MPRNLDHRVELLFPVLDRKLLRHLRDVVLERLLEDNRKARIGRPDGDYDLAQAPAGEGFEAQTWFVQHRGDAVS